MNPVALFKAWRAWVRLQSLWRIYLMTREPVMVGQIVNAAAVLLAIFGFNFTAEQIGAIAVVGGMIAGLIARARVSPVAKTGA